VTAGTGCAPICPQGSKPREPSSRRAGLATAPGECGSAPAPSSWCAGCAPAARVRTCASTSRSPNAWRAPSGAVLSP